MGRAQADTYISLFNKSDNVNLDETIDRKSIIVQVLTYTIILDKKKKLKTGQLFFNTSE